MHDIVRRPRYESRTRLPSLPSLVQNFDLPVSWPPWRVLGGLHDDFLGPPERPVRVVGVLY